MVYQQLVYQSLTYIVYSMHDKYWIKINKLNQILIITGMWALCLPKRQWLQLAK